MSRVAIIPARGGSRRIPGKNIKNFMGKPMLAYAIDAARNSGVYDEIMVSTDDSGIAEVARKFGAEVPFMRSQKNADDYATTSDVLLEVIQEYEKKGQYFTEFTCIYPCVPFLSGEMLKKAREKYHSENALALMSVARYSSPPQRGLIINEKGRLQYREPQYASCRTQDLEPVFYDAGMFYFRDTEDFQKDARLVIPGTAAFELPELAMQDIDNPEDWELAEFKFKILHG